MKLDNYPILQDSGVYLPDNHQCIIFYVSKDEHSPIGRKAVDFSDNYRGRLPCEAIYSCQKQELGGVLSEDGTWYYPGEFLQHCQNVVYRQVILSKDWKGWLSKDAKIRIKE